MAPGHTAPHGTRRRTRHGRRLRFGLARFFELVVLWHKRRRQRRELRELMARPDHLLKDMDITREDLYRECRKPFWRP